MSDHIMATIGDLQAQVQKQEREVADTKRLINMLCERAGISPLYPALETGLATDLSAIRRDQFYGKPLARCIREYLEMRRAANLGPATVSEIFDGLYEGGYKFDAKSAVNSKRGLRISLSKNTAVFHRLPDGKTFGLAAWYPAIRENGKHAPKDEEAKPGPATGSNSAAESAEPDAKRSDAGQDVGAERTIKRRPGGS